MGIIMSTKWPRSPLAIVFSLIVSIFCFSELLVGDEVTPRSTIKSCRHIVTLNEYRCELNKSENFKGVAGQQVLLYDHSHSWVATGEIVVVKHKTFIASFVNAGTGFYRGVWVEVDGSDRMVSDWSDSFGRP